MSEIEKMRAVTNSVGKFIEYWGFRNIHGRIWATIFLANRPISTLEIIQKLDVSKGLVSTAINELLEYELIVKNGTAFHGRYTYTAVDNMGAIIRKVLRERELTLLNENEVAMQELAKFSNNDLEKSGISPNRLKELLKLTKANKRLLRCFIDKRFKTFFDWMSLVKLAVKMLTNKDP